MWTQSQYQIRIYRDLHVVEGRTRSSVRGDLVVVQRTRTKFGGRAFVVAGPGGMEPVAVLRSQFSVLGQFHDGAEDIFLHS